MCSPLAERLPEAVPEARLLGRCCKTGLQKRVECISRCAVLLQMRPSEKLGASDRDAERVSTAVVHPPPQASQPL